MAPKKFYIASGLENAAQVSWLADRLKAVGWEHTYDWTAHGRVPHDQRPETAELETKGVLEAEVVIVLLPGGRGTHTELGIAIGSTMLAMAVCAAGVAEMDDRQIFIFSPTPEVDFGPESERTCVFYHHPLVERFDDLDIMVGSLLGAL